MCAIPPATPAASSMPRSRAAVRSPTPSWKRPKPPWRTIRVPDVPRRRVDGLGSRHRVEARLAWRKEIASLGDQEALAILEADPDRWTRSIRVHVRERSRDRALRPPGSAAHLRKEKLFEAYEDADDATIGTGAWLGRSFCQRVMGSDRTTGSVCPGKANLGASSTWRRIRPGRSRRLLRWIVASPTLPVHPRCLWRTPGGRMPFPSRCQAPNCPAR